MPSLLNVPRLIDPSLTLAARVTVERGQATVRRHDKVCPRVIVLLVEKLALFAPGIITLGLACT